MLFTCLSDQVLCSLCWLVRLLSVIYCYDNNPNTSQPSGKKNGLYEKEREGEGGERERKRGRGGRERERDVHVQMIMLMVQNLQIADGGDGIKSMGRVYASNQ